MSRICDFGSGIGNSIPFFRRYFPDAALTSSDVSERSLTLGKQRYPGDGNTSDRGQPHPLRGRRVRCRILGLRVPSHSHEEHVKWLKELHRITRSGGLIAIFEHNPLNPLRFMR